MKDIVAPASAAAEDYVHSLWSTPEFRQSPFIADLTKKVIARRPVFYTMTHPDIEWSHFTAWFGAFSLREYENKYVQDLYWLHEFTHFVTMKWDGGPTDTFHAWYRRAIENEFEASLESEAVIYLRIPELREKTFKHPIWVDGRLDNERQLDGTADVCLKPASVREVFDRGPGWAKGAIEILREERLATMRNPHPFDFVEQQMASYVRQNMAWAQIWAKRWREVEQHMLERALRNASALPVDDHVAWIESKMDKLAYPSDVPFLLEAGVFAVAAKQNKEAYGNHFL